MQPARNRAVKGLATVALLKVNFDAGRDHIGMFLPFALDVIRARPTDGFPLADVKADLLSRHGLNVPANTLETILTRAARRGFIQREEGRYFRRPQKSLPDLLPARLSIEREHTAVAERLREFASTRGLDIACDEDALGLLLTFLEQNQVSIILASDPAASVVTGESLSRRETAVVARFLQGVFRSEPLVTEYVQRMLEGLVLQNALLLRDIDLVRRRFRDLEVFFDTGFLFRALRLVDPASSAAAHEMLDLLRATNARLAAFEKTIEEVKRILRIYERYLSSSEGIKKLRPTDVTRYFLTYRYRPSDVAMVIALLEKNIRDLGMAVHPFPTRDPKYTLDEGALSQRLRRAEETDLEPRVMHDVDAVAAILTLRAGRKPTSLDDARAVFATTSGSVVKTVLEWYRENGETGVPPVAHHLALSNIAWLKKPASAPGLKIHELVALCSAALRPSRKVWDSFVRQLRELEESGQLSSDEYVAVVASELTEARLVELDDEAEVEAQTVIEVVERVKSSYAEPASAAVAAAEAVAKKHQEDKEAAEARAVAQAEEKRQLELRVRSRIRAVACFAAKVSFWITGLAVILGSFLTLPGIFPESSGWLRILGWAIAVGVAGLSALNLVWGKALAQYRQDFEGLLARRLGTWIIGSE